MLTRRNWNQAAAALMAGAAHPWSWGQAAPQQAPTGHTDFAVLAARYFDERMDLDPLQASALLADPKYEGRLEIGIAPDHIARERALLERVATELARLPPERLDAADRLSRELLDREVRNAMEGARYPQHLMPMNQWGGLPLSLANWAGGDQAQPLKTPTDYDNYLKRLRRLPQYNDQAIANMREGIKRGLTVPRPLIVSALPALKNLVAPTLEKTPYGAALKVMPESFTAADRARITRAYHAAYEREIRPSLQSLVAYLQGPYLAACRTSAGLSALPEGEAWYAWLVRSTTTTDMTPDEIHRLGLAEVARIHSEMASLQSGFGFKGDVTGFLHWHEQQPRFRPYKTWDEVLAGYEALNEKVVPQLPRLFGRRPKQPLAIRLIPELQRATTSPYYNSPSPDGSRPGIFFVGAPTQPARYNNSGMTSLLLHEGQPGHHFQVCIQQELALPMFRRYGWSDAFGEGWALYAETLGRELGVYEDPNQYLGHLKAELHRAVRLVTDTGLHAKGWTRERTMRYMVDNQGMTEADARLSTERYMAWPSQALAYKIGQLKFSSLRQRAAERLGNRFDVAGFHDRALAQGTLPLTVLEREIDAWISSASTGAAA
jgi:uncharacterized protein (DUF885 family)